MIILTQTFEKIVPYIKKKARGSNTSILLCENHAHIVVKIKIATSGDNGKRASESDRIFPVLFLYDLIGNKTKKKMNYENFL